jgi:hypothetical protein
MRANEFINESLDSKVDYSIDKSTPKYNDTFQTSATIGNRKVNFIGMRSPKENSWDVVFSEHGEKGSYYNKTGSGNELQVFSFVIQSMKDFIDRYRPLEIVFTANKNDESRVSLYKRLIKRFSIPGYVFTGTGDNYNETTFTIKRQDYVSEAPLTDYVPLNVDDKGKQFKPVDKKLIQHPVNKTKAIKFFEKTPYNFRLFFNDNPGLRKYREQGPKSPEEIQQIFGDDSEQILQNSENAITVVFIGNYGSDQVMMTPWIMAHRFGHAIQAGNRYTGSYNNKVNTDPWSMAESYFFKYINTALEQYYNKAATTSGYGSSNVNWSLSPEYNALFNAIGTQRSSREKQIKRPYEFLYELFAQYLKDGTITLNPFPRSLGYGRQAWGRPTKYMGIKQEYSDDLSRESISDEVAANLSNLFYKVLKNSVGKVYVM